MFLVWKHYYDLVSLMIVMVPWLWSFIELGWRFSVLISWCVLFTLLIRWTRGIKRAGKAQYVSGISFYDDFVFWSSRKRCVTKSENLYIFGRLIIGVSPLYYMSSSILFDIVHLYLRDRSFYSFDFFALKITAFCI